MVLAALSDVHKWYGEQTVLAGVHLELTPGSRTALIGRNGSGKSTLLRLVAKLEAPDGGVVNVRDGVQVGMLEQTPSFPDGASVGAVADAAFAELDAAQAELEALERAGLDDPQRYERWEALHEAFERRGGYARRARRDAVLHALGFAGRGAQPVAALSGGETTRLNLARLLMAQPDVALLDEPTNHLDLVMRAWLEGFLARYPGAVVVVSHDRAFLDAACSRTVEVRQGGLRQADLPPSRFREAERERERLEARTRENQAKEHERLSASATQMKRWAGQNAKLHRRATAMEGRLERFAATMLEGPPPRAGRARAPGSRAWRPRCAVAPRRPRGRRWARAAAPAARRARSRRSGRRPRRGTRGRATPAPRRRGSRAGSSRARCACAGRGGWSARRAGRRRAAP